MGCCAPLPLRALACFFLSPTSTFTLSRIYAHNSTLSGRYPWPRRKHTHIRLAHCLTRRGRFLFTTFCPSHTRNMAAQLHFRISKTTSTATTERTATRLLLLHLLTPQNTSLLTNEQMQPSSSYVETRTSTVQCAASAK